MQQVKRWFARAAWIGRLAERVLIETSGDRIRAVIEGADPPADAFRLPGVVLPAFANVHSHAFHRAIRGRTQTGRGDFWTWRESMYRVAAGLDPDRYYELARAVYAEMALAGVAAVGEFHYVHHGSAGEPYADRNAMGHALIAAAADAGVRLTLIDTCYLRGGFDQPLSPTQRRFSDGDACGWAERADALKDGATVRIAAGIHSVRAIDTDAMAVVRDWASARSAPLHLHLSEQPAENEACQAATGRSPAALADDLGVLGPSTTAVHATHVSSDDVARLGRTRTSICLCPTTERDLADGIGPARALQEAGSPLCTGSDSHAVIDPFEEARAIELDERLATGRRGHHSAASLLEAATGSGMAALGWNAGRLSAGALADFVAVDTRSPRLAGATSSDLVEHLVFAATAADMTHLVVGARMVVIDRRHVAMGDVGECLSRGLDHVH